MSDILIFLAVVLLAALALWAMYWGLLLAIGAFTWVGMKLADRIHGPSHPREY